MSAYGEGRLFGRKTVRDVDALLNGPLFAGFRGVENAITRSLSEANRILCVVTSAYMAFWLSIEGSQSLKLKGVRRTLITTVFSCLWASLEVGDTTYAEVATLVRVIAERADRTRQDGAGMKRHLAKLTRILGPGNVVHAEIDPSDEILLVERFAGVERLISCFPPERQIIPTHPSKNL